MNSPTSSHAERSSSKRVFFHVGNVANNGFYNHRILKAAGVPTEGPVQLLRMRHAMSHPAWEMTEVHAGPFFKLEFPAWVVRPSSFRWNWQVRSVGKGIKILPALTLLPLLFFAEIVERRLSRPRQELASDTREGLLKSLRRLVPVKLRRFVKPLIRGAREKLGAIVRKTTRPEQGIKGFLTSRNDLVPIVYGPTVSQEFLATLVDSRPTVMLEHGTVRWAWENRAKSEQAYGYIEAAKRATHLWVTNLDPATLGAIRDAKIERWSAFPHPYEPNPAAPYPCDRELRKRFRQQTRSEYLIFLPASQNWSLKYHDKGSNKALEAFALLRGAGHNVGLILANWGLEVDASKRFLESSGFSQYTTWVDPLGRLRLQRMLSAVDVVWDQFGLQAFGALALRVTEQGTPMVSAGLTPEAESLVGFKPPWSSALDAEQVVRATLTFFEGFNSEPSSRDALSQRYRKWFFDCHGPNIATELQQRLLETIIEPSQTGLGNDAWSHLVSEGWR